MTKVKQPSAPENESQPPAGISRRELLRKGLNAGKLAVGAGLLVAQQKDVHAAVEEVLTDAPIPPMIEVAGDELKITLMSRQAYDDFIHALYQLENCSGMEGKSLMVITMSNDVPPLTEADADKMAQLGIKKLQIRDNARGRGEDLPLHTTGDTVKEIGQYGAAGVGALALGAGIYYLWKRKQQVQAAGGGGAGGRGRAAFAGVRDNLQKVRDVLLGNQSMEVDPAEGERHRKTYQDALERYNGIKQLQEEDAFRNQRGYRAEAARKLIRLRGLVAVPLGILQNLIPRDTSGAVGEVLEGQTPLANGLNMRPGDLYEIRTQCALLRELNKQFDEIIAARPAENGDDDLEDGEDDELDADVRRSLSGSLWQALKDDPKGREAVEAMLRTLINLGISVIDLLPLAGWLASIPALLKVMKTETEKKRKNSKEKKKALNELEEDLHYLRETLQDIQTLLADPNLNIKDKPRLLMEKNRKALEILQKEREQKELSHDDRALLDIDLTPDVSKTVVLLSELAEIPGLPISIPSYLIPTVLQFRHDSPRLKQILEILRDRKLDNAAKRSAIERAMTVFL